MKKLFFIMSFIIVFGFTALGNATLIDNGGNLIYDTDLNITWYNPVNVARTWDEATSWATGLNVGGVTGWRLPSSMNQDGTGPCEGYNCTGSEMGHLYYTELGNAANPDAANSLISAPFTNLVGYSLWSSTLFDDPPRGVWTFHFGFGSQDAVGLNNVCYTLYVHSGNIGPDGPISTPEPATMLLLGLGLMGLVGVRRKFKK